MVFVRKRMKFDLINGMVSEHLHGDEMRNLRTVPQNSAVHVCFVLFLSQGFGVFASRNNRINNEMNVSVPNSWELVVVQIAKVHSYITCEYVEQNRKG